MAKRTKNPSPSTPSRVSIATAKRTSSPKIQHTLRCPTLVLRVADLSMIISSAPISAVEFDQILSLRESTAVCEFRLQGFTTESRIHDHAAPLDLVPQHCADRFPTALAGGGGAGVWETCTHQSGGCSTCWAAIHSNTSTGLEFAAGNSQPQPPRARALVVVVGWCYTRPPPCCQHISRSHNLLGRFLRLHMCSR